MPQGTESAAGIALLGGLSELADRYDALFCDVWGVLHDGLREYRAAGEALERYRASGGAVVLVTNAPIPEEQVARVLDGKEVRRSAWDAIVSSGDVTRTVMRERGERGVFHIGPDRDLSLFRGQPVARAPLEQASVAVVTGLAREDRETAEDYRELLGRLRARGLVLVCANPDRAVHVGDRLVPCAGVIGDLYEELGGEVVWAGKPYAPIYELALAKARTLRPGVDKPRILMIGDSVKTDLAGAARFGLDALFVARGVHRGAAEDEKAATALLAAAGVHAIGMLPALRW